MRLRDHEVGHGEQRAAAVEHLALVGEVEVWDVDVLQRDVLPDVHLRPVGEREHPERLADVLVAVVEVPELGALVLRVPLPEAVAVGEEALLGAGLLLVAAPSAERGVVAVLVEGVQQRNDLEAIAARLRTGLLHHAPAVDGVLHGRDLQPDAQLGDQLVAEGDRLGEVVPGVHVEQRERDRTRMERLAGEVDHQDRVLAAGEQKHGSLELSGDLAHHVDRLSFEGPEVGRAVGAFRSHSQGARIGGRSN